MNKNLIEIEHGTFIFREEIKFIISSNLNTTSINKIVKKAKKEQKYFKLNKDFNSFVITADNTVYACKSKPKTLYERLMSLNYQMLDISEDYFIALLYIKVLSSLDNILVSDIKKKKIVTTDDLQFVHQREKRKSIIFLTTNEIVYLSRDASELVKSISDVNQYEGIFCD